MSNGFKFKREEFNMNSGLHHQGELNLQSSISAGSAIDTSLALANGDEGREGLCKMTYGSEAGQFVGMYNSLSGIRLGGGSEHIFKCAAKQNAVPTATNDYFFHVGFGLSSTNTSTYMVAFVIDRTLSATNFVCITKRAGAQTTVDSGVKIDTEFHNFEFQINSDNSSIAFGIDGNLVAVINSNLPNASMGLNYFQRNVAGGSGFSIIDSMEKGIKHSEIIGASMPYIYSK